VRNLFNQYEQAENRVTHALLSVLNEDRVLLGRFLREVAGVSPPVPPRRLALLSQRPVCDCHIAPVDHDQLCCAREVGIVRSLTSGTQSCRSLSSALAPPSTPTTDPWTYHQPAVMVGAPRRRLRKPA